MHKITINNFTQRLLTGVGLVLAITTAISFGVYSFVFLMLAINLLALLEFYRLFYTVNLTPRKAEGIILSAVILLSWLLVLKGICSWKVLLLNVPATFSVFISELFRQAKNPFYNIAFTFLGVLYITIPLCFFISIAFLPFKAQLYHSNIVLGCFFILWTGDSAAYIIGKIFGSHSLFKRISPKKTWEGSLGGAACALLIACITAHYFTVLTITDWICIACIIIIAGTFGDLIKSLMKRSLNVKDSGTILPGHGGMLDRFDSLLGSAPFVFCYLLLFRYA